MMPLHAAPLAFWLIPCLCPATAQVVVKLDSPAKQGQAPQGPQAPGSVLRVATAPADRLDAVNRFPAAVAAVDAGLKWLLAHQDEDGRWSAERFMKHDKGPGPACDGPGNGANDVGVTALAVLALAREGPAGAGGPRKAAIERGAKWLVEQQEENGLIGGTAAQGFVYGHAIAAFALCAAHAATGDVATRDGAQKAIAYLEHHRNPYGVWRYTAREADGDSSITTWAVLALVAAGELGLKVDPAATKTAAVFFDAVTSPQDGRVGYTKTGEGSSRPVGKVKQFPPERAETLTAAGIMCRQALGQTVATAPIIAKGNDRLQEKPPQWEPKEGCIDHCYWFFGTEAMRGAGGDARKAWNDKLVEALGKGQRTDGSFAGSWDPIDAWGDDGGRVYATALSVLALQALYGGGAPPKPAPK